jgi:hypothetical protein
MSINEEAYKEAWAKHGADWMNLGGGAFARQMIEAYEVAKAINPSNSTGLESDTGQPVERTLSQKIDDLGERLVEQQGDDQFRKLFWRIARILKCLPSSFADDNEHVIKAAEKAMEHKSQQPVELPVAESFQQRVQPWMMECFGSEIAGDKTERNHGFIEEALELVQACGATASECHQLVDYVFGRPFGEPYQESGGVMVTHAALCLANGLDMHDNGEVELARVWTKVDKIRAKQTAKPKHSPLPQAPDQESK